MRRFIPLGLALIYSALPLFPSFIALTGVAFPGVSLLPIPATLAVLGLCCILAVYALVMFARYPQRGCAPLLLPLLSIFAAGVLAGFLGFDPRSGLLFTFIAGLGIIWHVSILRFYNDRHAATALFCAYLLSGGLAAAVAIVAVVLRVPPALYALQHGRATGTFILPGELAGYLIVLLPIAFAVARITSAGAIRALAWSVFAVGFVALVLTFSRAGWMGAAAAAAFLVAARTRRPAVAASIAGAGLVAIALLFNAHHDPSEDYTRLSIWQAAVQIVNRFPLLGVGPFNFSHLYALVRAPDGDATAFHAHSLYLTFFAEFGLVGVAAVAWTMWRFARELRSRLAAASPRAALLSCSVAAGLVGVGVQGLIDTVSVVIFGLWMPTMALALAAAQDGAEGGGLD
ncbi:MAG TPA: O-antigen ligase family protein [Candidatus Cybelea sp.]|jgi:O-antigen ligase|nr:O-antigen ligase family protein [Candidatus Cybelea sp.]